MQRIARFRRSLLLVISLGLLIFSAACAGATPTPTTIPPTAEPTTALVELSPVPPTATTEASIAPTAEPTATESPAATASPTSEPSPTPAPSPTVVALEPFDPELAALLQAILEETVAEGFIPGAVLSVNMPGYEPWTGAAGVINRQTGAPMQPDTRIRIASISKTFSAVVALQLYEEGRLDLDTPVANWFPDLLPRGNETTVRQLLNHTSGLYDYLEDPSFGLQPYQDPNRSWQPRELVEFATRFPLSFEPGAPGGWDYSSTNYVLLGMIIEQVTGNSLAQEMESRIFEPLNLDATFFAPDQAVEGQQASGYSNNADLSNTSMSYAFATANLVSTAADVRRFGEGLFGGELLQPETMALMETFENGYGQYNMPELEYGLGIMRNRLVVGPQPDGAPRPAEASRVMGHIGGFGGFRSALWHAPANDITIALGINQFATDPNALANRAFDAILTAQDR